MDNPEQPEPIRQSRTTKSHPSRELAFLLLILLLIWLLLPSVRSGPSPRREACTNNTRQLAIALMYYEAKNGHLPPAFIVDNNGKPMHSWRVLILPFLDRKDLYDQYDFSEPWNGPHNSRLMRMCPEVFRCPSAKNRDPSATSYVAIVGNGTAWPGDKGVSLADIKDGPDNTIVLVEVADSDINWLEPRDVTFDQAIRGVNVDKQHGISSNHPGIANVAYADGHVECLSDETPPATLRALLTIAGGEKIE